MVWSGTRPESASACTGARRSNACVLPAKPPPACVTFVARPCYHLWCTGLSTTGPHLRQCMCTRLVCTPGRVPCSPFPPISGGHHVCGPSGIRRVCRVLAERSVHPPSMYKHLAVGALLKNAVCFRVTRAHSLGHKHTHKHTDAHVRGQEAADGVTFLSPVRALNVTPFGNSCTQG